MKYPARGDAGLSVEIEKLFKERGIESAVDVSERP